MSPRYGLLQGVYDELSRDLADDKSGDRQDILFKGPRPPKVIERDSSWQRDAVCQDAPPEWFDGSLRGSNLVLAERQAILMCDRCPVARECLQDAIATEAISLKYSSPVGVRGGLRAKERIEKITAYRDTHRSKNGRRATKLVG